MSYLMGLPTKRQAEIIHIFLGGRNVEKDRLTRDKNRKKRKSKCK